MIKTMINKATIIANFQKNDAKAISADIVRFLESKSIAVNVHGFIGSPGIADCEQSDLIISLGGDGTVLYSARLAVKHQIPILAVNIGDIGFITEVSREEWAGTLDKYLAGDLSLSQRLMLDVSVVRNGSIAASYCGLNDAVISAAGISKVIRLMVHLSNSSLGQYRADGIIIATPTGSTAYSAAAGGPILEPTMEAMIINPICPFTLSNRPIVLKADEIITIAVPENQRSSIILTVDGQLVFPLLTGDLVILKRLCTNALIVNSDKRDFYEVLRQKLNWSGGPDA